MDPPLKTFKTFNYAISNNHAELPRINLQNVISNQNASRVKKMLLVYEKKRNYS